MGVFERKDRFTDTDRLFCIAGLSLFMHVFLFDIVGIYPFRLFLFDLLFWPMLGFSRSKATVPSMSQARNESRKGRTTIANL
jgi:hypothetical protein